MHAQVTRTRPASTVSQVRPDYRARLAGIGQGELAVLLAASDMPTGRQVGPEVADELGEWAVQGLARVGLIAAWWRDYYTRRRNMNMTTVECKALWGSRRRWDSAIGAAFSLGHHGPIRLRRYEDLWIDVPDPHGMPGGYFRVPCGRHDRDYITRFCTILPNGYLRLDVDTDVPEDYRTVSLLH